MKNDILDEMIRFQTDRGLHKNKFDLKVASLNILEELMEAHGVEDECKDSKNERKELLYNALLKLVDEVKLFSPEKYVKPTTYSTIDAFCDIAEFAIGEPLKLGYEPRICLAEMAKEINSRRGKIIDGKFEKDKSEDAKYFWYDADYSKALLGFDNE